MKNFDLLNIILKWKITLGLVAVMAIVLSSVFSSSSSTEKLTEYVSERRAETKFTEYIVHILKMSPSEDVLCTVLLRESLWSEPVVGGSFLRIAQYSISFADLFEFLFCTCRFIAIRMIFKSQLAICFFYVIF